MLYGIANLPRLALTALARFAGSQLWALDIVLDGKGLVPIVVPDDATPVVQAAAKELAHHIELASGVALKIVPEQDAPGKGKGIYVGPTAAAAELGLLVSDDEPNVFVIKLIGDRLFLLGDDSDGQPFWILHNNRTRVGTLFAVYEFLEQHLDARWIWPGATGEIVPRRETIQVARWDQVGRPAMVHTRWRDGPGGGAEGWADPAERSRFINDQARWLRRHRFALGRNLDVRHSFAYYWDKYGAEHPEYFNQLPDGSRRPDPLHWGGSPRLVAMCVSNPDLQRQVVERFAAKPVNPGRLYVDASENDTPGRCLCEKCLAWDVPDPASDVPFEQRVEASRKAFAAGDKAWAKSLGSLTDRYCRFWLAVQEEARKRDPNAIVLFHGYANYVRPPLVAKMNRQMLNSFVPGFLFPWTDESVAKARQDWLGWAKAGCSMMLRPNYLDCGHNLPIFYARRFGEEFNFAWTHGMMSTDYDALPGQYATQGLNHYVVARLNHSPGTPVHRVFEEFYAAFGPAAPAVREYFAFWEKLSAGITPEQLDAAAKPHGLKGNGSALYADFYMLAPTFFTPEVLAEAGALLSQAEAAVAAMPLCTKRVEVLRQGLANVALTLATQRAYEDYRRDGKLPPFAKALDALDSYRAAMEPLRVVNMNWLYKWELRHWDRTLVRLMGEAPGERLPDPWQFAWDPDGVGEKQGWHKSEFDDSAWSKIGTEGTWEDQGVGKAWAAAHDGQAYDGLAWYRTRFQVKAGDAGKRISLLFGAVDEACIVWLNGQRLLDREFPYRGNRDSWQEAFEVDISQAVKAGSANTLAVRVQDDAGAGGIWKPVWLLVAEPGATAGSNRLANGGFEKGEGGWQRHVVHGSYAFSIDRSQYRSGRASARVVVEAGAGNVPAKGLWGRWHQQVPVEKGRHYTLTLWARTDPAFTGRIRIFFTGDKEKKTRAGSLLNTNGVWRQLTVEGYEAAGDRAGVYLNVMDGTGSVWFDDVQLIEAPGK